MADYIRQAYGITEEYNQLYKDAIKKADRANIVFMGMSGEADDGDIASFIVEITAVFADIYKDKNVRSRAISRFFSKLPIFPDYPGLEYDFEKDVESSDEIDDVEEVE